MARRGALSGPPEMQRLGPSFQIPHPTPDKHKDLRAPPLGCCGLPWPQEVVPVQPRLCHLVSGAVWLGRSQLMPRRALSCLPAGDGTDLAANSPSTFPGCLWGLGAPKRVRQGAGTSLPVKVAFSTWEGPGGSPRQALLRHESLILEENLMPRYLHQPRRFSGDSLSRNKKSYC